MIELRDDIKNIWKNRVNIKMYILESLLLLDRKEKFKFWR